MLAVALTGLLLLVANVPLPADSFLTPPSREDAPAAVSSQVDVPVDPARVQVDASAGDPDRAVAEATGTLRSLARSAWGLLPKIAIAIALLVLTAVLLRLLRLALHRVMRGWQRADAATALVSVALWLLALGVALSVLAGDVRALVGSVGLVGLGLSWALQVPIESFTGWMLNSFRAYYRVGDRIMVGDVFGDVYRIDVLTTTLWESGGPDKPVQGSQPTGALVTFPNSEILRANVVNYTRDFPFVWDELTLGLAQETDIGYASDVLRGVAEEVLGEEMRVPVALYQQLLEREGLDQEPSPTPQVYLSPAESWTDLTIRYLAPARARRLWATRLLLALDEAMKRPEHRGRIVAAVPRHVIEQRAPAG